MKPVFIDLTESDDEIFLHNSPQSEKCTVKQQTTDSYSDTTDTTDWTDLEPFSSSLTPDTVTPLENVQSKRKRSYSVNTPTTTSTTDSNEETEYQIGCGKIERELLLRNISRGKPFPTWYFERIEPQHVTCIPLDITGTNVYKIKTNAANWSKVTSDLRHFHMLTSSREGFVGQRRIGTCLGSYVCRNRKCPFVLTSKDRVPNKVSWRIPRGRRSVCMCSICDPIGHREGCGARKLVEYDKILKIATVYHIGDHKCGLQLDINKRNSLIKQRIQERNLLSLAKQIGMQEIAKFIDAGSMDLAAAEAACWVDRRAIKRQMDKVTPEAGADHNSFDAVGILKRTTDKRDKYYIYNIGNKNFADFSDVAATDHVFKSSSKMAEIALQMNEDAPENLLQLENAYFDVTHTHVYGFKTFGLWMIHPAMKQILHLASMEIRSENYVHIAVFFKLFNSERRRCYVQAALLCVR